MAGPENAEPKQDGRFKPGQSGNPAGRPKGLRNRATRAAEALLDNEAEALTRRAIDAALTGDGTALRICMDRLIPPRRDRPVSFELPPIETAADASRAMAAILSAVAVGDLSPGEGEAVGKLVELHLKALEACEFEARLAALESVRAEQ